MARADVNSERWSQHFGPFVKVDLMVRDVILNMSTPLLQLLLLLHLPGYGAVAPVVRNAVIYGLNRAGFARCSNF